MKIVDIKHIEVKENGEIVNELLIDSFLTSEFVSYLKKTGKVKSATDSYFVFEFQDFFILKGIEGSNKLTLMLKKERKSTLNLIKNLIHNYRSN